MYVCCCDSEAFRESPGCSSGRPDVEMCGYLTLLVASEFLCPVIQSLVARTRIVPSDSRSTAVSPYGQTIPRFSIVSSSSAAVAKHVDLTTQGIFLGLVVVLPLFTSELYIRQVFSSDGGAFGLGVSLIRGRTVSV